MRAHAAEAWAVSRFISTVTTQDIDYLVTVVLDPLYADRLRELAGRTDIWVVSSDENRSAAEAIWAEQPEGSKEFELTIWSKPFDLTIAATWSGILGNIELHHGEYSHEPPVNVLEFIGVAPSEVARQALAEYSYSVIELTASGFRARKSHVG